MESPQEIGKFRVLRLLGQGAMGRVFLAEDPLIDRKVAIKVMAVEADDEARERFRNEARAAGRLSHPNIVQLHEFGFYQGQPYLVMEHLLGESLDRWLLREQPLEARLSVLLDLCQAIAHAHSREVLHRDVKPANLQVLPDGVCKLMDFGIARSQSVNLTATGMILGTPEFLSPEVLQDAGYSTSSDVYAVGVLAYQVLGGANPFHASTLEGCLTRVLTHLPPPLTEVSSEVPAVLSDLISGYMCKAPDQRPSDVVPLIEALQRLLDRSERIAGSSPPAAGTQVQRPPVSTEAPTIRGSMPHSPRGRRLPAAALVAFAAAGLLAATILWRPWSEPDQLSEVAATPTSAPAGVSPGAEIGPEGAGTGAEPDGTVSTLSPVPAPPAQGNLADASPADRRTAAGPGLPAAESTGPEARGPAGRATERKAAPPPPEKAPQDVPASDLDSGSGATLEPDPSSLSPSGAAPASAAPDTAGSRTPATDETTSDLLSDDMGDPAAVERPPSTEPATEDARQPPAGETSPGEASAGEPSGVETSTPAPRIDSLAPMVVRRGSTAALRITGAGFGPETEVVIRRGGRPVRGLRILSSKIEGTTKLRITLLVDRQSSLGTYTVTAIGAGGLESNSVGLEVGL